MSKFEKKVTSTIKIVENGTLSEARAAWMGVISDRPVAIEILKRMSPETSEKLTVAIRTVEEK
tara:strand:- start:610 stop:798 length:189 start_codon:yes stop_codon:yes gene_type:complete